MSDVDHLREFPAGHRGRKGSSAELEDDLVDGFDFDGISMS